MRRGLWVVCALLIAGCYLTSDLVETTTPTSPAPTLATLLARDASDVMAGICFESAFDAAGQVFVLRSTEDQIHFYDLADNSHLCKDPVQRVSFDFSGGRVLAGLWSKGKGCTARHDVQSMSRDDDQKTVTIKVQFTVEGDCGYDLVRPFWLAIDRMTDYTIDIQVNVS